MEPTTLEGLGTTERDEVERWREHALEQAGYSVALARTLAARFDVDLHQAVELVERGCESVLAALILL